MRSSFFIAKRYLFAKKTTNAITWISWISVIGVTIGTAALFVILSVFNGFEELNLIYYKKLSPDLKVIPITGTKFDTSTLSNKTFKNDLIDYKVTLLEGNVLLKYNNAQYFANVKGVSDDFMKSKELDSVISAGSFVLKENGNSYAVIGSGIEYALGIDVSQPLGQISIFAPKKNTSISTIDPSSSLNRMEIFPSGMFSVLQEMDDRVMFVPIEFAENLLDEKGQASAIDIYLKDEENITEVQHDLETSLPKNFKVKNRYELNEALYKVLNTERWAVYLVLTFILIIAICNIIGSITMLIIDKKKDIAVLRTMGATFQLIQRIYFFEGMMIALAGTFLGLILGAGFSFLQLKYGLIQITSADGVFMQAYPVKIILTDFLLVFATVFSISLVATWFTSKQSKISDQPIKETIMGN